MPVKSTSGWRPIDEALARSEEPTKSDGALPNYCASKGEILLLGRL